MVVVVAGATSRRYNRFAVLDNGDNDEHEDGDDDVSV